MAISIIYFFMYIIIGKIQNARIDAHVHSLDLEQDLEGILQNHATDDEVEDIKGRVQKLFDE